MRYKETKTNTIAYLIFFVACFILHLTLAPFIAVMNGHLNFLLLFVFALAFSGQSTSMVLFVAFLTGLIFDLSSSGPLGLMSLEFTLFVFISQLFDLHRFKAKLLNLFEFILIATAFVMLFYVLIMLLVGATHSLGQTLLYTLLPSVLLNSIVLTPCLYVFGKLVNRSAPSGKSRSLQLHQMTPKLKR